MLKDLPSRDDDFFGGSVPSRVGELWTRRISWHWDRDRRFPPVRNHFVPRRRRKDVPHWYTGSDPSRIHGWNSWIVLLHPHDFVATNPTTWCCSSKTFHWLSCQLLEAQWLQIVYCVFMYHNFRQLKNWNTSASGLVVKSVVAIDRPRVRFPAGALTFATQDIVLPPSATQNISNMNSKGTITTAIYETEDDSDKRTTEEWGIVVIVSLYQCKNEGNGKGMDCVFEWW